MTRVLIADDHALVRDGLRHILRSAGDFDIVGEAADAGATLAALRATSPDMLLLDLSMPGRNGLDIIKQIREAWPAVRVLVLTMHAEEQYAKRAFAAGASRYLTKESAARELVSAVSKVAGGGVYVSVSMAERFARDLSAPAGALAHDRLTDREFDVLRYLAQGEPLARIASRLSISAKTVSTYKTRILDKLALDNDAALVRYAVRHKLIDDD